MSKRKIITMPDELQKLIDKAAAKTGASFSEWVRDAIREKLGVK